MPEEPSVDRRFWFLPVGVLALILLTASEGRIEYHEAAQEAFKVLLEALLVTFGIAAALSWRKERNQTRATKHAVLAQFTAIDRELAKARWLIEAHKSARSWKEQLIELSSLQGNFDEVARWVAVLKEKNQVTRSDDFETCMRQAHAALKALLQEYSNKKGAVAVIQERYETDKTAKTLDAHWTSVMAELGSDSPLHDLLANGPRGALTSALGSAADVLRRDLLRI